MYLTKEEYINMKGVSETDTPLNNIDVALEYASEKIDEMTFNRILSIKFENLSEFQKAMIKKSMLEITNFYILKPEYMSYNNETISSYSVGDISVSLSDNNNNMMINSKYNIPNIAYLYLLKTGLMNRTI